MGDGKELRPGEVPPLDTPPRPAVWRAAVSPEALGIGALIVSASTLIGSTGMFVQIIAFAFAVGEVEDDTLRIAAGAYGVLALVGGLLAVAALWPGRTASTRTRAIAGAALLVSAVVVALAGGGWVFNALLDPVPAPV